MFFSRLAKREKYLLYVSATVVVFVFFDKAIFSPVMTVLDNLNRQISIHEKDLENSVPILNKEEFITSNYTKKIKDLEKVSSNEEDISAMSSEIERLARKTSVLIKNIKPLPAVEQDLYVKYKIDVEAEGDMPHLIDFIYQLEKTPQLYRVKKFNSAPRKKDAKTLKVSLLITRIVIP